MGYLQEPNNDFKAMIWPSVQLPTKAQAALLTFNEKEHLKLSPSIKMVVYSVVFWKNEFGSFSDVFDHISSANAYAQKYLQSLFLSIGFKNCLGGRI